MSSRLFSIDYKTDKYNIKRFNILSGFTVEYNDIHIEKLEKNLNNCVDSKIYEINYCFEGRFECVLQDGTITYMTPGDFSINPVNNSSMFSFFPIKHYSGITIYFNPNSLDSNNLDFQKLFGIDYLKIIEYLCKDDNKLFITRNDESIKLLFNQIQKLEGDDIIYYLRLKTQELFLYLKNINTSEIKERKDYYTRGTVEIIKNINSKILDEYNKDWNYDKLSKEFSIKLTTMKNCYKTVYGETIYDTLRKTRLDNASKLLRTTDMNLIDIALSVGYSDQAGFSKAFKKMFNLTPHEYKLLSD